MIFLTLKFRSWWVADFAKMSGVQLKSCNTDVSSGDLTVLGVCPICSRFECRCWKQKCHWLSYLGGDRRWIPPGNMRGASVWACLWEVKSLSFYREDSRNQCYGGHMHELFWRKWYSWFQLDIVNGKLSQLSKSTFGAKVLKTSEQGSSNLVKSTSVINRDWDRKVSLSCAVKEHIRTCPAFQKIVYKHVLFALLWLYFCELVWFSLPLLLSQGRDFIKRKYVEM
jgi:hypothetical protein